jgi:hypothetical protein
MASFWWFSKPFWAVNRVGLEKNPISSSQNGRSIACFFGEVPANGALPPTLLSVG